MIFLLGLGLSGTSVADTAVPEPTTTITLNEFSRDKTLFDSGVAVGRNLATVPVSGTGTPGEVTEVRVMPVGGAPGPWVALAPVAADGSWSGTLTASKSAHWNHVEARVQSEPFVRAISSTRFGVGHVIAIWGQSEVVRMHSQVHDSLTPDTVLDDDSVQAMWMDAGSPVVHHVAQSAPHSSALVAFANTLMSERPGDKFAVVFQAVSGTGIRQLVDDGDTARMWADDKALHDFATADGQSVGLPAMSWFASPGALGEFYDDALLPLFTGKDGTGATISFPATINYGNSASFQADHWFGELYDMNDARWVAYGPHRFDITAPMATATELASGGLQQNLANKQEARIAWRDLLNDPQSTGHFLPQGIEPLTYLNGVDDGAGGWTDVSHPAGDNADGAPLLARLTAHAVLQAAGLSTWDVPVFDQVEWDPDGAYVEFWSSEGAITTIRQARGEAALPGTFDHWTDVVGWQINGAPAERAEIVDGRVRLYPNAAQFVHTDVVNFGEGGATGMIAFPEDAQNALYKDWPIVDFGHQGIEGIPISALPDATVLANPLPATSPEFTTGATGPRFADTQALGAGVSEMQFVFDGAITLPASGTKTLMTTTGNYLKLEVLPSGTLRARVRDTGGTVHVNNVSTASGVVSDGVVHQIVMAIDMTNGFARVWVDGVSVMSESFTSATPEIPSNRTLLLLATNTGSAQAEGTFSEISVWKAATADGTEPATPAYKTLVGPASVVNADPWKQGDDAV